MKNLVKYLDLILAPMILISLFFIESNPILWLSYVLGCFGYIFVNWKKGLIAIKNFLI